MKKSVFYLILLAIVFSGCDETYYFIDKMNTAPKINSFAGESLESFSDSVKVNEFFTSYYNIKVTVYDPNDNISSFRHELLSGAGELYQASKRVLDGKVNFSDNLLSVKYKPIVYGEHSLKLIVGDDFDEESAIQINLTAFKNLAPVSVLSYNKVGVHSKYEYELIGTESFDRDATFGGEIKLYEFTFQNKRIETEKPVITHVFPGEIEGEINKYMVGLRVKDQDGAWSEQSEVLIDITK